MSETFLYEAAGFSMYPFIKSGDRIVVRKLSAEDLKIGDIILYKSNRGSQSICHRLVRKEKSEKGMMLFVRGDTAIASEAVSEDCLIGQVVDIIRNGKVMSLNSGARVIINWFIARFYIYLRPLLVWAHKLLRKSL